MKVAFLCNYDLSKPKSWPSHKIGSLGTSFYMAKSISNSCDSLIYIGPFEEKHSSFAKLEHRFYSLVTDKKYHYWAEPSLNKYYAQQIEKTILQVNPDFLISPSINLLSYLNCHQPLILWADSTYDLLISNYQEYDQISAISQRYIKRLDKLALTKCSLAIFSSDWAAQNAIEVYQIDSSKVKVVPTGANLECDRTLEEIQNFIKNRSRTTCKLLFIGLDWYRKGGDISLEVAQKLNNLGIPTELTVLGCSPNQPLPNFVNSLGFIDKFTASGKQTLEKLYTESHFLILPSKADCTPAVIREAASFGVPALSTKFGGITTLIVNNQNGKMFNLDAKPEEYVNYIKAVFCDFNKYYSLALSSFEDYQNRLSWDVAGKKITDLLKSLR